MSLTTQSAATETYQSIALPLEDLEQTITYESGLPQTISVTYQGYSVDGLTTFDGVVYTQTLTRDGDGNVTDVSLFIPQD